MNPRNDNEMPQNPVPRQQLPQGEQHIKQQYSQQAAQSADTPQYVQTHAPDVRTLLAWIAPNRPFHKRGKEYFVNIFIILLAVEVILFLFHQYMLMVLAVSVVFLAFTLATVPPHPFRYRISTQGITVEDHYFLWQELYDFYFKRQDGADMLTVRTKAYMPGELTIVLGEVHREHVKEILLPYLPFREYVKPSFLEKTAEWLSKTFPLEKTRVHPQQ
jgi:hypothetical protein